MTERQHFLEEAYKIEISANQAAGAEPVGIGDVSPLWEETMNKAWQIYTGQSDDEGPPWCSHTATAGSAV